MAALALAPVQEAPVQEEGAAGLLGGHGLGGIGNDRKSNQRNLRHNFEEPRISCFQFCRNRVFDGHAMDLWTLLSSSTTLLMYR